MLETSAERATLTLTAGTFVSPCYRDAAGAPVPLARLETAEKRALRDALLAARSQVDRMVDARLEALAALREPMLNVTRVVLVR